MVKALHGVTHQGSHTVDSILRTYHHYLIAYLHTQIAVGKEVHARTADAGYIHSVHGTEMQRTEGLAVHIGMSDQDVLAHQIHSLFLPLHFTLFSDEGNDGFRIVLSTDDKHLVVSTDDGVTVGDRHLAVMQETADDKVASQKLAYLQHCASVKGFVGGLESHLMRCHVRIGRMLSLHLFLFLVQVHPAEIPQDNGGTDDSHHTQRVSTGITIGDGRCIGRTEYLIASLVGSTQSRCVRYSSAEHTHHHGEVDRIIAMTHASTVPKHQEEQAHTAQHIQKNNACGQEVKPDAPLTETLKETWPYLQSYTVNEQDETEVLDEVHEHGRTSIGETTWCPQLIVNMTGHNTCKENKRNPQGHTSHLKSAESYAHRDDKGIEQHHVCYTVGTGKKTT